MADGNVSVTVAGRFIGGGLFTARAKHEGKPAEYNAVIVLDDEEYAKVKAARDQAVAEKWGKKIPPGVKDYTDQTGDDPEMASFEKQYINPKSKSLDRNGSPKAGPKTLVKRGGVLMPTTQDEGVIYPGCYVAASITVYAVDGDKAKSIPPCISTSLQAVLFLKDGERLGSDFNAEDAFAGFESAVATDDDAFFGKAA